MDQKFIRLYTIKSKNDVLEVYQNEIKDTIYINDTKYINLPPQRVKTNDDVITFINSFKEIKYIDISKQFFNDYFKELETRYLNEELKNHELLLYYECLLFNA